MSGHASNFNEPQVTEAAVWLARVDRGLTGAEQKAYAAWLAADPAHERALQRLEQAWRLCDRLGEVRPAGAGRPNPDLLTPRRHLPKLAVFATALAGIAAVLVFSLMMLRQPPVASDAPLVAQIAEQPAASDAFELTGDSPLHMLDDGSEIRSLGEARIEVLYTEGERRIRLLSGEAFFSVAHDPNRPFVVETVGVTVHALGTVFRVALCPNDVAVEVTEGSVEVRKDPDLMHADFESGIVLAGGEKIVVRYARLIPYSQPAVQPDPAP